MAAPYVTGAAALYAATHPGATALQIRNAILGAAKSTVALVLGVVLAKWLLVLGALLFIASAAGWFNDVRRQHAHPAPASLEHGTDEARTAQETAGE